MKKLFSKNSNLCDHNSPTLQTDRQTDRQTTCDRNTALCTKVHRAVKTKHVRWWNVFGDMQNWLVVIIVLVWRKSMHFWRRYAQKNLLHFRSMWPQPLTSRPQISFCIINPVQLRCTKLEVSTTFLFRENRRHGTVGRTDGVQRLMRSPSEGRIIKIMYLTQVSLMVLCLYRKRLVVLFSIMFCGIQWTRCFNVTDTFCQFCGICGISDLESRLGVIWGR